MTDSRTKSVMYACQGFLMADVKLEMLQTQSFKHLIHRGEAFWKLGLIKHNYRSDLTLTVILQLHDTHVLNADSFRGSPWGTRRNPVDQRRLENKLHLLQRDTELLLQSVDRSLCCAAGLLLGLQFRMYRLL
jgi:hypothetical protein